jgi:hypothetical protein
MRLSSSTQAMSISCGGQAGCQGGHELGVHCYGESCHIMCSCAGLYRHRSRLERDDVICHNLRPSVYNPEGTRRHCSDWRCLCEQGCYNKELPHQCISPEEGGWTVANENGKYNVPAL